MTLCYLGNFFKAPQHFQFKAPKRHADENESLRPCNHVLKGSTISLEINAEQVTSEGMPGFQLSTV